MNERVVYSIFKNGSDAVALGGLIEVVIFGGLFIVLILFLRNAKKKGRALVSRNARTMELQNFLADHAGLLIAVICCLAFALIFHLWSGYRSDHEAIASGNYKTMVGTLAGYRVARVIRPHHSRLPDGIAGLDSTFREQDAIIVNGRTFYVACDRPIDMLSIGNEGRCLALRPGQEVRIDFIETPDAGYRTEPLRISVIE